MPVLAFLLLTSAVPPPADVPSFASSAPVEYMVDLSSGAVLVDQNSKKRIPPASMTKMMTARIVVQLIAAKKLSLKTTFKVDNDIWNGWDSSGSTMHLKAGQAVPVKDLLHGLLTASGNDAAIVLARGVAGSEDKFVAMMNAEAKKLAMADSHFGNVYGWPDGGKTYSSAQDLALLAWRIISDHPAFYRDFFGQSAFIWNAITEKNHNPLIGTVEGADGVKTGHSNEAGYCLVGSLKRGDRRLLFVIAGSSTEAERASEAVALANWGYSAWQSRPLFRARQKVTEIPVQLGSASHIAALAPDYLGATLPAGYAGKMRLTVRYNGPIKAPLHKGQKIAELVVRMPGARPQIMPLVAAQAVGPAGYFGRAWNGAKRLAGE